MRDCNLIKVRVCVQWREASFSTGSSPPLGFKTFSLKLETLNEAASRGNVFASALLAAPLFGCGKERCGGWAHNNND